MNCTHEGSFKSSRINSASSVDSQRRRSRSVSRTFNGNVPLFLEKPTLNLWVCLLSDSSSPGSQAQTTHSSACLCSFSFCRNRLREYSRPSCETHIPQSQELSL